MAISLRPGTRLFGAADATEVIIVKAPTEPLDIRIGGHPALLDVSERRADLVVTTPPEAGSLMGKRYVDTGDSLELLCTKPGIGAVAIGDELLAVKDAKPLPASD